MQHKSAEKSRSTVGELSPDKLYTVEGLWKFAGVGPKQIRAACAACELVPAKMGKRYYFTGAQIIEWILNHGRQVQRADRPQLTATTSCSKEKCNGQE